MGKRNFGDMNIKKDIILKPTIAVNDQTQVKTSRIGRPKKVQAEKKSVAISFLLTEAENSKLIEKAGITPKGAYIRYCLKEAGVLD